MEILKKGEDWNLRPLKEKEFDLTDMFNGHNLAIVACGISEENYFYYRGPHDGGAILMGIGNVPEEVYEPVPLSDFAALTMQCIRQYPLDQKIFIESFLEWNKTGYDWNGDTVTAHFMFGSIFEKRAVYIKQNIDYYAGKFNKMQSTGVKTSWNWCAFLFTSYWLIYRKMYKEFAIVAVLEHVLIPAAASIMDIFNGLNIVVIILLGLFGNYLYMQHIDRLIDGEPIGDDEALAVYHEKNGGTTYYVWIYLGAVAVLNMISPFA